MRRMFTAGVLFLWMGGIPAGALPGEKMQTPPTKEEIADAFRSGTTRASVSPGKRFESWRVKKIRGWELGYKRLEETRSGGEYLRHYLVTARSQQTCAEYQVRQRIPQGGPNPHLPGSMSVEPMGTRPCR